MPNTRSRDRISSQYWRVE